jgi:glycopeptide antibiotics resistance protein
VITTFLVEHPWITTVALIAVLVIGLVASFWLVERPRFATWLGLVSLFPIAALTLVPANRSLAAGCATEWQFPTLGAVELVANVVLFIPPALLLGVSVRRPVLVLVGASIGSGLVEVFQASVTALGRSCSTNDWLANTLGSALGAAIAALAIRFNRAKVGEAASA